MAILVTNDDGYTQGLKILLESAKSLDKDSYAIIPNKQKSGVSKAITLHKPVRVHKRDEDIFEINGTPADCVEFSLFCHDFKKPNLVLSGINWGDNTALHTIYSSGTLAACIEATLLEVPAIGFSVYRPKHIWREKIKDWGNEKLLKKYVQFIVKKLKNKFDENTFFSVNFPDNMKRTSNVVVAEPQRHRFDIKIEKRKDPDGRTYHWITGPNAKKVKGKDFETVHSGKTIITPITLEPVKPDKISSLKKLFR